VSRSYSARILRFRAAVYGKRDGLTNGCRVLLLQAALELRERSEQLVAQKRQGVESTERRLRSDLFGITGLQGDVAGLSISRRDAEDRVRGIEHEDEALTLMEKATNSGDEVLARVIAQHAYEHRWTPTVNAYLETRPHKDAAFNELWNLQPVSDMIEAHLRIREPWPAEQSGLSEFDLRQIAAQSENAVEAVL
jgi:hypothetical protein